MCGASLSFFRNVQAQGTFNKLASVGFFVLSFFIFTSRGGMGAGYFLYLLGPFLAPVMIFMFFVGTRMRKSSAHVGIYLNLLWPLLLFISLFLYHLFLSPGHTWDWAIFIMVVLVSLLAVMQFFFSLTWNEQRRGTRKEETRFKITRYQGIFNMVAGASRLVLILTVWHDLPVWLRRGTFIYHLLYSTVIVTFILLIIFVGYRMYKNSKNVVLFVNILCIALVLLADTFFMGYWRAALTHARDYDEWGMVIFLAFFAVVVPIEVIFAMSQFIMRKAAHKERKVQGL